MTLGAQTLGFLSAPPAARGAYSARRESTRFIACVFLSA